MKKFISMLLTVAMAFSLTGCGGNNQPTTANPTTAAPTTAQNESQASTESPANTQAENQEKVTLNVAYMPNYASLWSVLTGIDQGYFAEEGLEIELWEFTDGPAEIAAMESGNMDLAYIGKGAHKLCILGQATIFAPSSVHTTDTIVGLSSHGVNSVEDLAGKTVAYTSGSSSETTLNNALAVAGLTMDDVTAMEMTAENMVISMISGSIDACAAWSPYTLEIYKQVEDAVEIEFNNDSVNLASWICMPSYAENNHDILIRFSRALYKAMDYASKPENFEYVAEMVAKQTGTSLESSMNQTGDADWFDIATLQEILADGTLEGYYNHLQEDFVRDGVLTEADKVDVNQFVLLDLIKESLE